ncbi:hypothetical protein AVEN_147839-1 [Araneus ventricosus]|uniref:Uncharacterized protein n=1 Tax=Araneus ventricosus TaxID=182803 RepID=A0A4Y2CRZ2_ARAVE|nr:hypothetical protein AVEN_147839-1 [Araneus ventricosus]
MFSSSVFIIDDTIAVMKLDLIVGRKSPLSCYYVCCNRCFFHDVSGCIGHNGAATSATILTLPGPARPVADEQMKEVPVVLENDNSTTTSLIEDFPKTTTSQDILEEISTLPSSSNKDRKRKNSVQVKRSKLITPRTSK